MDRFIRAGMPDPGLPGLPQPGTMTGLPAAHLTFAGRSSWFAENLMSTDLTPPDARCAVNLGPLERDTTAGPGKRPSHLPDSGSTHNSLNSQAPRPSYPRIRGETLRSIVKMLDRRSE